MKRVLFLIISLLSINTIATLANEELEKIQSNQRFINRTLALSHFQRFFEDGEGVLWGCTMTGDLAVFDGVGFIVKAHIPSRIYDCVVSSKEEVLISSEAGVYKFNTNSIQVDFISGSPDKLRSFVVYGDSLISICDTEVIKSAKDFSGRSVLIKNNTTSEWIGACQIEADQFLLLPRNGDILKYQISSNSLESMRFSGLDSNKENISDIVIRDNRIFLSTDCGLYTASFEYGAELKPEPIFSQKNVECIIEAKGGDLWVGTDNGLYRCDSHSLNWEEYHHIKGQPSSLLNECVWDLYEDHNGNIWISVESGVSFVLNKQNFKYVEWTYGKYSDGNRINCMIHDTKDRMWLGGVNGLLCHDYQTDETILFKNPQTGNCFNNRIWQIYEDHLGIIWICTDESIGWFDEANKRFVNRFVYSKDSDKNSKWTYYILDSEDGYMWLASGSGSFMKVKRDMLLANEEFVLAEDINLSENINRRADLGTALRITRTHNGEVWGLSINNLYQLTTSQKSGQTTIKELLPVEGLDRIYTLLTGSEGFLWGFNLNTICCIDPNTHTARNFLISDWGIEEGLVDFCDCGKTLCLLFDNTVALLDKESLQLTPVIEQMESEYRGCYYDKKTDLLWLGGIDHCMVVDPQELIFDRLNNPYPVRLFDVNKENNNADIRFSNGCMAESIVPYSGYYYRLKGVHAEWSPINRGKEVLFQNLHAGNYEVQLAKKGLGSEEMTIVQTCKIDIPQVWYKTWWFCAFGLLCIIVLVFMYMRHYSLRLQLKITKADRVQLLERYQMLKDSIDKQNSEMLKKMDQREKHAQQLAAEHANKTELVNRKFLDEVNKHVEKHFDDVDFSVARLSELTGLNEKALYRRIKTITGCTTIEYIKKLRMQQAALLLQHKEFSVNEVMYMVGFTSASYFSKCFEEAYGKTPSEYRSNYQ